MWSLYLLEMATESLLNHLITFILRQRILDIVYIISNWSSVGIRLIILAFSPYSANVSCRLQNLTPTIHSICSSFSNGQTTGLSHQ